MTKTETNLQQAIIGEAKARLEYTAFAMQAMQEGRGDCPALPGSFGAHRSRETSKKR